MKSALGVGQSSEGFPQQMTPSGLKGDSLPIPSFGFHGNYPGKSFKQIFDQQKIYVIYFHNKVQTDFSKNQTHPPFRERVQNMASRSKYEILATAAEPRCLVRDNGVWCQSRTFRRQLCYPFAPECASFLQVSYIFYSQANTVSDGRNTKHKRFAW